LDEALVLSRLLHFTATFLLLGISAFLWKIAPGALSDSLERRLCPLLRLSLVVAAVTALTTLLLVAASMGEGVAELDRGLLVRVLLDTGFGNAWLLRLGLVGMLIVAVALSQHFGSRPVVMASALVVASLGLVGHAAMDSGVAALLREINHAIHLTAAALWVGGLVPLALVLAQRRMSRDDSGAVLSVLRRFSGIGHVLVALVIATGAINTWFILGGLWINMGSSYQTMLLAKICLVVAMLFLATVNRYLLLPRLGGNNQVLRLLYCSTLLEVFLGFMAIGLVSYFATLEPV
jgi:putative copper resistance protein D